MQFNKINIDNQSQIEKHPLPKIVDLCKSHDLNNNDDNLLISLSPTKPLIKNISLEDVKNRIGLSQSKDTKLSQLNLSVDDLEEFLVKFKAKHQEDQLNYFLKYLREEPEVRLFYFDHLNEYEDVSFDAFEKELVYKFKLINKRRQLINVKSSVTGLIDYLSKEFTQLEADLIVKLSLIISDQKTEEILNLYKDLLEIDL